MENVKEEVKENNRKYIATISFLRKFIVVFFNLFFNLYILKIVNNDLNFIIKYTLLSVVMNLIFEYIILKIINSKNARYIYISSFILQVMCITLLIIFKQDIIRYIYPFKTINTLATVCYSAPYELMIISSSGKKYMSSFLANLNMLERITTILTPIFSGFIIEKFSYNTLFYILVIEASIIVLLSFKIKDFTISDKKLEIKKYYNKSKDVMHIKDIYKCMFFRRISTQGAIVELLPIILFLRLGKELSFGTYNSIFAILSIIALEILKIVNSKKLNKKFYVPFAVIIFISSLLTVFNPSFIALIFYYVLINTLGIIIESESCSYVYSAIKVKELEEYKKEHIFIFNIYMTTGQLVSYLLVYVLYNYFNNVNILSVVVSILMFFLIISSIYLRKTVRYFENRNNE